VVRAIVLHFWLAYDHPFSDGNGRTARALFYHSMLRQGYWLTEFLSISRSLYEAPAQYGMAFLHTETDDNDLTYFLLHQLQVLLRAIDELYSYLDRKAAEVSQVERALRRTPGFNHRQLDLLGHALRHPDSVYTISSHAGTHNVVYQTARLDLLDLEAKGLLDRNTVGREFRFYPARNLSERLDEGSPR
jgi:Fic family protein